VNQPSVSALIVPMTAGPKLLAGSVIPCFARPSTNAGFGGLTPRAGLVGRNKVRECFEQSNNPERIEVVGYVAQSPPLGRPGGCRSAGTPQAGFKKVA
jgi:hypothetical protein